eukprot:9300871-Karenia_brevis.AAC.1
MIRNFQPACHTVQPNQQRTLMAMLDTLVLGWPPPKVWLNHNTHCVAGHNTHEMCNCRRICRK